MIKEIKKELTKAIRKTKLDLIAYGSSVIHISEDGTVKHIPIKDFYYIIEKKE